MNRPVARGVSWVVLLGLAAFQTWLFRHEISPDGLAYLDLSDAVVQGRPGDLVNGYWSPMYPVLIGLLRLMVAATPLAALQWEFALIHVANFGAFVLALAAFELFLRALDEAGARWGHQPLRAIEGRVAAYVLFGVAALDMISTKATVPDLLLGAACFASFACCLRLHANPGDRRTALLLGFVLAGGALTKSIMFPLGVVILATLAWPLVRVGGRTQLVIAAGTFVAASAPWIIALSVSLGRFSTGETGALNYAWYVNGSQPPNTGVMPALAAPPDSLPLDGLAVMPESKGTNPLWYDPARWHRDVRPTISLAQQGARLEHSIRYFGYVLAPFLLALAATGAATRWRDTRTMLSRSFVVVIPCLAAIAAYSLVYTTSRHIAPFLVAGWLAMGAAFPRDAELTLRRFLVALAVTPIVLDVIAPLRGRILLTYGFALAVIVWVVLNRASLGAADAAARLRRVVALGVVVVAAIPGILMGFAALGQPAAARSHYQWETAQRLMQQLPPGSRIAVMGNPDHAGWARLARYRIVAVVPPARVDAFKALSEIDRARIVAAFQRAGAVQIVEIPPPSDTEAPAP